MKKVARMRISPNNMSEEMSTNQIANTPSQHLHNEPPVRTTGRIKKPKAVFDPSDNYIPRSQRIASVTHLSPHYSNSASSLLERRASSTKSISSTISPVEAKDACMVCKKKESKRPSFANRNPLISCTECQKRIHKQCLKVEFEDFEHLQSHYVCDQCSNCRICKTNFNNSEDDIITCSKCAKSFHLHCFPTKIIKTESIRSWKCNKCQIYNQITNGTTLPVKKIREIIGSGEPLSNTSNNNKVSEKASPTAEDTNNGLTHATTLSQIRKRPIEETDNAENGEEKNNNKNGTGTVSPTAPEKRAKNSNQYSDTVSVDSAPLKTSSTNHCYSPNDNFDDIPDVKEWTVEQVYDYFFKHFPKEAHVFKEEEIDGRSLLLLKRSDVVKKLPIKLGPSLRIYSLILKIQAQLNDPTLGWNCGL